MIYKPTVILKCLSNQTVYINKNYGQMFYYTDKNQIWFDTQDNRRILASDIIILNFERERTNFVPSNNDILSYSYVYVIETNCLYKYTHTPKIWNIIYGIYGSTTVAQTYYPNGDVVIVNADDVTTNGILDDGSVVIRDSNKMICGLLLSDGYTLSIQSLIGGQINMLPSGSEDSGCLQLNSNSTTNLNNDLLVFGSIKTTDKNNWNKQYRLLTENVNIIDYTLIKKGSKIKATSQIGDIEYNEDTILLEDLTINDKSGLLVAGCKIYKDSIINNIILKPPFLFDIDNTETSSYTLQNTTVNSSDYLIENTTMKFNFDSVFVNNGDTIYIETNDAINSITKISFNNADFAVDYISKDGIDKTARICYYSFNNKVKILP